MNLILCGLPMCGKTTVGQALAEMVGWNCIDTDRHIEAAYAKRHHEYSSCREIFSRIGARAFYEMEKQQIALLAGAMKSIIAVGGGSLNDGDNVRVLQALGRLVYLRVPATLLWERVQWRGIPAYVEAANPEQSFYEIVHERTPVYEKAADLIIDVGHLGVQEIVTMIVHHKELLYGK